MSLNGNIDDAQELKKLSGRIDKIEIDTTLKNSGCVADAKAVGDAIEKVKDAFYLDWSSQNKKLEEYEDMNQTSHTTFGNQIMKKNGKQIWSGEAKGTSEIVISDKWSTYTTIALFVQDYAGTKVYNGILLKHLLQTTSASKKAYILLDSNVSISVYRENDTDIWVTCPDGYTVTAVYGY